MCSCGADKIEFDINYLELARAMGAASGRPPGYDEAMAEYLQKWLQRTELQVVALVIVLIVANHFLGWGLGVEEVLALAGVSGAYAIARGQAKKGTAAGGGFVLVRIAAALIVGCFALGLLALAVLG